MFDKFSINGTQMKVKRKLHPSRVCVIISVRFTIVFRTIHGKKELAKMSEKGELAKKLFEQGYNCTQAVVGAYADELGLDFDIAMKLVSGFGGGMGRMREVCGAVSGMVFVASMKKGYNDPKAVQEKRELYAEIQKLAQKYREKNGSIVCRELLAGVSDAGTDPNPSARTGEYYQKRPCGELIKCAAEILEEL